jgi:NADH-quinone oxidoreductase subunit H
MSWEEVLKHSFSLPAGTPQWAVAVTGLIGVFVFLILPSGVLVEYLDRKLGADFQARIGPSRVGLAGLLQPIADTFKLIQKESSDSSGWREALWWAGYSMAVYSTVAVLPLGSLVLFVDTDMSAFLPFGSALVLALGTMLLGINSGSVAGWFGGMRVAAQALTGAFPALVSLLCAGMHAGAFRWSRIVEAQGASPLDWGAFSDPFQLLAFLVFVVGGLVLLGIPPMDAAVSAPDIGGGVTSHLSGRRLILFRLGRFYGFFLWSVIAVALFLGGWSLPRALVEPLMDVGAWRTIQALEATVLLFKAFVLMLVVAWIARVNPRTRVDQVTDFSWKILSPAALVALTGSVFFVWWRAAS